MNWLSREFVLSGYDLKHLARVIMTSMQSLTYLEEFSRFHSKDDD